MFFLENARKRGGTSFHCVAVGILLLLDVFACTHMQRTEEEEEEEEERERERERVTNVPSSRKMDRSHR